MKPIERLQEIMAKLRDKETGCPWDVEQDFASIIPHTLEEAYEVADAVAQNDMKGLREELGDLLLQVVFHAQMAQEKNLFSFDDVAQGISDKLVRRHPHVFGDAIIKTAAEQTEAWEKQKTEEKKKKAEGGVGQHPLKDIALALPAMTRAYKLQKQAARVGFDWANLEDVFDKLEEELQELQHVITKEKDVKRLEEEMGDVLFCCVNIARKLNIDPETALRGCNRKFEARFSYMHNELDSQHRNMKDASLQELSDLWDQAKIVEKAPLPGEK